MSGSVQATDRLMKELRDIYRSPSFKGGEYRDPCESWGFSCPSGWHLVGLRDGSFAVCSAGVGRVSGFGVLWLGSVGSNRTAQITMVSLQDSLCQAEDVLQGSRGFAVWVMGHPPVWSPPLF